MPYPFRCYQCKHDNTIKNEHYNLYTKCIEHAHMRKIYLSDYADLDPAICPSSLELDPDGIPLLPFNGQPHVWNTDNTPVTCSECGTEQGSENI